MSAVHNEDFFSLIVRTYNRPDLFARLVLGVTPRTWQREICQEIERRLLAGESRIEVLIRTCHGAGKTFFAAAILLWWMVTRYNSRGLTTAPTWSQVEGTLWPEIAKLYNRSIMRGLRFGRLLTTEIDFGETWFATGASSDRPENLEGQHSDTAAIRVIDEAKAVESSVFEATKGLLDAPQSLDLWISTPSIEAGDFFRRDIEQADPKVIRRVVTIDDLLCDPLIDEETKRGRAGFKADAIRDWGEDSAEYQSRVMARYIDNAEGALFPSSWIERAMCQEWTCAGVPVAGMDVAGSVDGDQSAVALVYTEGDRIEVRQIQAWNERDTMKSKGRAVSIAQPAGASLRVDTIGIGKGVADAIAQDRYPVEEYRASEKPKDAARFSNRKAEDAWSLRQKLEKGQVRLPADQKLKSQMRAMKYEILQTGKLRIVDPEDSPDLVDAVIIACASPRVGYAAFHSEDM